MDILRTTNWIDILIIVIMLRVSYCAFQRGLSHEMFPLFGSVVMISLSLRYYSTLSSFCTNYILKLPAEVLDPAAFLAILVASGFALKVFGAILDTIIKVSWHPLIERFGGLLIGVIKAAVVTSMVLCFLVLIPISFLQRSVREGSLLGMHFLAIGPNIYGYVSQFLPTVKIEKTVAPKDELMRQLVTDKSLMKK